MRRGAAAWPAAAMTKLALRRAGSYQPADDSQRLTLPADGVTGATRALPPLATVTELACQYPARPAV